MPKPGCETGIFGFCLKDVTICLKNVNSAPLLAGNVSIYTINNKATENKFQLLYYQVISSTRSLPVNYLP